MYELLDRYIIQNKNMGKIGYFLFSLFSVSIYAEIMITVSKISAMINMYILMFEETGTISIGKLVASDSITGYLNGMGIASFLIGNCIAILVFKIWYHRNKIERKSLKLNFLSIIMLIVLATGCQMIINTAFQVAGSVQPELIHNNYALLHINNMPNANVITISMLLVLTAVCEELLCRGVVIHYVYKITNKFWVVNVIQAMLFGIIQLNIIEGIYAFVLGLFFGYVYNKYQSLIVAMVFHFICNVVGYVMVTMVLNKLEWNGMLIGGLLLSSLVLIVASIIYFDKQKALN